jgi:DNA-binding transcriptional LysR family regulator
MRYANIEKADLNLLLGLQALLEERSVTRAAQRMHLSQPAMSRVLDRLQEMFRDELIVRAAGGYEPTTRASSIYSELSSLLPRIDRLLQQNTFNPADANHRFRIAAGPYASVWLMPRLIESVAKHAPGVHVEVTNETQGFQRLETNQIDLLLSTEDGPPNLPASALFEEPYMCLLRPDNALGRRRLTLRRYLAARHVSGQQPLLEDLLKGLGHERDVRVKIADPFAIGMIVAGTDLIGTLALQTARQLKNLFKLQMVPAPAEIGLFKYSQIWHPRNDSDPAHLWLRVVVANTCTADAYTKFAATMRRLKKAKGS